MIWKCLIVDDDPIALKIFKKYTELVEQLDVVGLCNNAFQAMALMKTEKVDLIFLETELPNLLGISFIKTLPHPPKVIFLSTGIEYAVEAFELGAVDYLLKPVSLERFLKSVNRVINIAGHTEDGQAVPFGHASLYFRANRKMVKVCFEDIIYVESVKDYIKIYRNHDMPLMVKQSLTSLELVLPRHQFIRIHRSYLVSLDKVTAFTNNDVEIGEIELPIGRQFYGQLKKFFLLK